jgi:hypothetical protein
MPWLRFKGRAVLNLHDSSISDSGLVHLKGLTNLTVILLYRTQVSDAGLVHLKGLTNLSYLQLDGTQVPDAGVQELKQALPSLRIITSTESRGRHSGAYGKDK